MSSKTFKSTYQRFASLNWVQIWHLFPEASRTYFRNCKKCVLLHFIKYYSILMRSISFGTQYNFIIIKIIKTLFLLSFYLFIYQYYMYLNVYVLLLPFSSFEMRVIFLSPLALNCMIVLSAYILVKCSNRTLFHSL